MRAVLVCFTNGDEEVYFRFDDHEEPRSSDVYLARANDGGWHVSVAWMLDAWAQEHYPEFFDYRGDSKETYTLREALACGKEIAAALEKRR